MELKEYIKSNSINKESFASKIGTTSKYLNLLIYKQRRPSPDLACKIETATKGIVSFRELLLPDEI